MNTLESQLARLLASQVIRFDGTPHAALPAAQGVYRIFDSRKPEETIRAGRTIKAAGGLRQRVYQNHFMGNQNGNLRAQLVGAKVCSDLKKAKTYIRDYLAVQVLVVEDDGERARLEHFMLDKLRPRFADERAPRLSNPPPAAPPIPAEEPVESLHVSFTGPFGWFGCPGVPALSQSDIAHKPGLYLWTYATPHGELVYYVGETARSFLRRMNEHLSEQLSGRYRLYEPEAFARAEKKLLWRGVYGPGGESSVEAFVDRLQTLAPPLGGFVRSMRFHIARVETSDRLRRRVEAMLAQHLYEQEGIVGGFQEPDIHYAPRTDDEQPVEVHFAWQTRPCGVPDTLLA